MLIWVDFCFNCHIFSKRETLTPEHKAPSCGVTYELQQRYRIYVNMHLNEIE